MSPSQTLPKCTGNSDLQRWSQERAGFVNTRDQFSALPPGWSCSLLPAQTPAVLCTCTQLPTPALTCRAQAWMDFPKKQSPEALSHGLTPTGDSPASWGHLGTPSAECHHCPEPGRVGQHRAPGTWSCSAMKEPKPPSPHPHPLPNIPPSPLVWGLQEGWRGIPELCP